MNKKKLFRSSALYLLFFTNTAYAAQYGPNSFYWLTAILTGAVAIIDISEAIHGRKK